MFSSQADSRTLKVPVCERPAEVWDQGLEDGKKNAPGFLCILQTLNSLTNCEVQDYWEWQLIANCYGFKTHTHQPTHTCQRRLQASIMHSSVWTSMMELIHLCGPPLVAPGHSIKPNFIASKG